MKNEEIIDQFFQTISLKKDPDDVECLSSNSAQGILAYQNNYLYSHLTALKNHFPTILIFLGDNNFNFLARRYIVENPSRDSSIDVYGQSFPQFLGQQKEVSETIYILDLANLDYLFTTSFLKQSEVSVYKNSFLLWSRIKNHQPIENIEISTSTKERVVTRLDNEGNSFLVNTGVI
jgi:hypothetical protein